jgi:hypothetical protein
MAKAKTANEEALEKNLWKSLAYGSVFDTITTATLLNTN